jgi:hypothetical protein
MRKLKKKFFEGVFWSIKKIKSHDRLGICGIFEKWDPFYTASERL